MSGFPKLRWYKISIPGNSTFEMCISHISKDLAIEECKNLDADFFTVLNGGEEYICDELDSPPLDEIVRFRHVCSTRNVTQAQLGMRVRVDGQDGLIAGANDSNNFDVIFPDEGGVKYNCHPNWKMTFLDDYGNLLDVKAGEAEVEYLCKKYFPALNWVVTTKNSVTCCKANFLGFCIKVWDYPAPRGCAGSFKSNTGGLHNIVFFSTENYSNEEPATPEQVVKRLRGYCDQLVDCLWTLRE